MEVNQGQLLKLISVRYNSIEVNHSMKLIRTPVCTRLLEEDFILQYHTSYALQWIDISRPQNLNRSGVLYLI